MGITPSRVIPPLSDSDRDRFWAKVSKGDGCWFWRGTTTLFGYGLFSIAVDTIYGRLTGQFQAHRVAYTLATGPIPTNMSVLHSCDRPSCVRPDHLRVGTYADNLADKISRNRHPRGGRVPGISLPKESLPTNWGERHFAAKLTNTQIRDMRETYRTDSSLTVATLARQYCISKLHAGRILSGQSRTDADGPVGPLRPIIGTRVVGSKLTPEKVAELRARKAAGETVYDLAIRFGINPGTVSNIIRRNTWKHVLDGAPVSTRRRHLSLTPAQVTKIRQRHAAGTSQVRLATDYGISRATICMVVNRKTHV